MQNLKNDAPFLAFSELNREYPFLISSLCRSSEIFTKVKSKSSQCTPILKCNISDFTVQCTQTDSNIIMYVCRKNKKMRRDPELYLILGRNLPRKAN